MKTELKITVTDESGMKISYTEDGKEVELNNERNFFCARLIVLNAKEALAAAYREWKGNEQSKITKL